MKKKSTFFEIERRQKILVIIFFVLLFIGFLVWFRYLKPETFSFLFPKVEVLYPKIKKIRLKIELTENPILKILEPFPQIEPPTSTEIGRENPFLPSLQVETLTPTPTQTTLP
jgi:hypothetical protein